MKNEYYQLCCSALPQPTANYYTYSIFNKFVIYTQQFGDFGHMVLMRKKVIASVISTCLQELH